MITTTECTRMEHEPGSGYGLLYAGALVRRHWGILFACLLIGTGLAVFYSLKTTVLYDSKVQILVMKKDSNLPTKGAEGGSMLEGRIMEDLLATHMQMIRSPRVVQRGLTERGLHDLPSIQAARAIDQSPTDYVIENLHTFRGGEGQAKTAHVLNVQFRHTSPEDAAAVLNAIVESYQTFLGETLQNVGDEAVKLITRVKTDLEESLREKEDAYRHFREDAPLLWSGNGQESVNVHRDRLGQIQQQLGEIDIRRSEVESRLATINNVLAEGDPLSIASLDHLAILDDKNVNRLALLVGIERGDANSEHFMARQPVRSETARSQHDHLLELMLEEEQLVTRWGDQHPSVRSVRQRIETAQKFLQQNAKLFEAGDDDPDVSPKTVLAAYTKLLSHDLNAIDRWKNDLKQMAAQQEEEAKALVAHELEGESLLKEIDRQQQLYDVVINRLRELNLVKDYGGFVTEVISPVTLGEQTWPNWFITLPLGMLLGLVLGFGTAYTTDLVDRTFRDAGEIQEVLNSPVLAHIPTMRLSSKPVHAGERVASSVFTYHRPQSREAEVFRSLRTLLYFGTRQSNQRVIQVTSPHLGDGKSTLISNLAVALGQAGKSVLLIDVDFRRPRISQLFEIPDDAPGLSRVLVGQAEWEAAIVPTAAENLSLLPSGPLPSNPAELLVMPRFSEMLAELKEKYDYVLLDTPPLMAVSDPAAVAVHADGVLLVTRIRHNGRPAVEQSKELLDAQGARMVGVVVNGLKADANYATGGYGYGYGYGQEYSRYTRKVRHSAGNNGSNGNGHANGHGNGAVPTASPPPTPL